MHSKSFLISYFAVLIYGRGSTIIGINGSHEFFNAAGLGGRGYT